MGHGSSQGYGSVPPLPRPLPLPVVDNHTHLDIARGDEPRADVAAALAKAREVGVDRVVQIGCDLAGAQFTEVAVREHPSMLGGVALHPNEMPVLQESGQLPEAYAEIERIATQPRIRVVGETGLDYFRTGPDGVAAQQAGFRWHIDLAKRLGKALQIHDRDAHDDVLRILDEEGAPAHTVMHCFSGDVAMARVCVDKGYFVSVSGVITFKNAQTLRDAVAQVPLELLLVETDAPYLTPSPYRGATNAPYLVPLTIRALAELKSVDVPTICTAVSENAERIYGPW